MVSVALKEWAVVIEAIAQGKQSYLLRKGGISENSQGFELLHDEFLLFPTWEHQQKDWIQSNFHSLFNELVPENPDRIQLKYQGSVGQIFHAPEDRRDLTAVAGPNIWGPSFVDMRYDYRPDLPLYVVEIKIQRLSSLIDIEYTAAQRGCKSWVELDL